jgi:hypothetical protein
MIAQGINCSTPLYVSSQRRALTNGFAFGERKYLPAPHTDWTWYFRSGYLLGNYGFPSIVGVSTSQTESRAISNYYQALASAHTKFKGMVTGGELRETFNMLKSPFSSLKGYVGSYLRSVNKRTKGYRGRNRKEVAKAMGVVGDTWLEYSFGLRPLISDCDNAVDAFFDSNAVRPLFEMVRGYGYDSTSLQQYNKQFVENWNIIRVVASGGDQTDIQAKIYGICHLQGDGYGNLHRYGVSPWEFVPTLWELIPYSFLVDYFTNIGKILESWAYRSLSTGATTMTTTVRGIRTVDGAIECSGSLSAGYVMQAYGSGGSYKADVFSISRRAVGSAPSPSLTLKVPGNWSQWVNLTALAATAKSISKRIAGA